MIKRVSVAIFFVAILLVAVARAGPVVQERQPLLLQATDDYVRQLSRPARVTSGKRPDLSQGSTYSQLKKCRSRRKGMLIGAAIGAVAGAATGVYVVRGVSGILGTSNGASRFITYTTVGGAGAGALGGMAYCR